MYTPDDRLGLEQTHKNTKDTTLSRLLPLASVESSGSNCSPCSGPCVKVDSSQTGWPCLWLSQLHFMAVKRYHHQYNFFFKKKAFHWELVYSFIQILEPKSFDFRVTPFPGRGTGYRISSV